MEDTGIWKASLVTIYNLKKLLWMVLPVSIFGGWFRQGRTAVTCVQLWSWFCLLPWSFDKQLTNETEAVGSSRMVTEHEAFHTVLDRNIFGVFLQILKSVLLYWIYLSPFERNMQGAKWNFLGSDKSSALLIRSWNKQVKMQGVKRENIMWTHHQSCSILSLVTWSRHHLHLHRCLCSNFRLQNFRGDGKKAAGVWWHMLLLRVITWSRNLAVAASSVHL